MTILFSHRLALVQEHKEPVVPVLAALEPNDEDRLAILDDIKAMIPDHNTRLASVQVRDKH